MKTEPTIKFVSKVFLITFAVKKPMPVQKRRSMNALYPTITGEILSISSPAKRPNQQAAFSFSNIQIGVSRGRAKETAVPEMRMHSPLVLCSRNTNKISTHHIRYRILFFLLISVIDLFIFAVRTLVVCRAFSCEVGYNKYICKFIYFNARIDYGNERNIFA